MKMFTLFIFLSVFSISLTKAQYCVPTFDANHGECRITNVKFAVGGIDRTSGANELYVMTTATTSVAAGSVVPLSVTSDPGTYCPYGQNIAVYIDYNHNFKFDLPAEEVFVKKNQPSGTYTIQITIPANATIGTTRLRVMNKMIEDCGHTPIDPCGTDPYVYHGEVEDYEITITEGSGVEEMLNLTNYKVYNSNSQIKIDYNLLNTSNVSINILNILGQKVYGLASSSQNSGSYSISINTEDLNDNSSFYIIQLVIDGEVNTLKIVR